MSKKDIPTTINSYYAPAFEKLIKMQAHTASLPPAVPKISLKERLSADSLIQSSASVG
jgi:hypothetical protein